MMNPMMNEENIAKTKVILFWWSFIGRNEKCKIKSKRLISSEKSWENIAKSKATLVLHIFIGRNES